MTKKKRPKDAARAPLARHPANPKAQRSGSGFHEPARYSKKERRANRRSAAEDADL